MFLQFSVHSCCSIEDVRPGTAVYRASHDPYQTERIIHLGDGHTVRFVGHSSAYVQTKLNLRFIAKHKKGLALIRCRSRVSDISKDKMTQIENAVCFIVPL